MTTTHRTSLLELSRSRRAPTLTMIRRSILVACCLIPAWYAPRATRADDRPNIVLIIADDLGYAELSCHGGDIPTPHIDSIARDGVRFTNGYVTASYCSPSRAALITGRYQARFGHDQNPIGRRNLNPELGLALTERTVADDLRAAGYRTALVGKWHLGATPEHHPQRRGFDEFFGFLHEGHFYVPGPPWNGVTSFLRRKLLPPGAVGGRFSDGSVTWSDAMGNDEPPYDEANPILRGDRPVEEREFLTDAFAREAIAFIERNKSGPRPFFLCVSFNAPHSPMQAAVNYMDRFRKLDDLQRRVFAAMVVHLDDAVGRVLEALSRDGLEKDTLVGFLSDHGGPTQELTSSNRPLRAGKGSVYEGGLRVPMFVKWPGKLPAGSVDDRPVVSFDLSATMLAAAGVRRTSELSLDGVDLVPYLNKKRAAQPHDAIYWHLRSATAVRVGRWKLVQTGASQRAELYDLVSDVSESRNVADAHGERVADLRRRLDAWRAEMAGAN